MQRILLTGATGFVGRSLLAKLATDPACSIKAAVRSRDRRVPAGVETTITGDIDESTDWRQALENIDVVVHAAALAHRTGASADGDLDEYRGVNTAASLNLAKQSADAGIGRFVFLSSIGVLGTVSNTALREDDQPRPQSAYAISKLEAETGLQGIAANTGLDLVIVRPPMVYGPGSPGNFARLVRLVQRGMPLPLASIQNRRSFVSIANLVDFLHLCLFHPAAANRVFHVSDDADLSTPELIDLIARSLGKPARLFRFPPPLLAAAAAMTGRARIYDSLCGNLPVDISRAREMLGWRPVCDVARAIDEAIRKT